MQPVVLSVGRLVPRKGHVYLIDAVRKLADANFPVRLEIVGSGPEEQVIRKRAGDLDFVLKQNLSDEQLDEEYKKADVFALPSITDEQGEKEGLGLVILEAMHFGLPVIAFDNGGVREAVIDGYNGVLLPEKDVDELADAIRNVLTDLELRKRLTQNAYADIHGRFSVDAIVKHQVEIYERVLSQA